MDTVRAAAVSWEIREVESLEAHLKHATELIDQAVSLGAELVVLPESIDLERISYLGRVPQEEVADALSPDFPVVKAHFESLAKEYNLTIVAGTHLNQQGINYVNSALICTPTKSILQNKNVLTQWEVNEWNISPGYGLQIEPNLNLGTLVCYDCEFPLAAQSFCEAGAQIIAVPAFNEVVRGFNRVRWSCHARAVECQIFILHAALVGTLHREPVARTYGSSAILCPSVDPFHESGILSETPFNQESIAIADLDLNMIEVARNQDDVRNWHDRNKGDWTVSN
ncbi:MAG: nitrilase-related carbon-nitrogen hydrolase [Fimbriimonadaceae bacterium]